MTARLTVVIPSYNSEGTLAAAIESVLNQSMPDLELLCVDDGSTDGTARLMESYASKDPRVRLCRHETNRGIFLARQTATLMASCPYIMYLDADDVLRPDACATALKAIQEMGADMVHFRAEYRTERDTPYPLETESIFQRDASGVGAWEGLLPGVALLDRFFLSKSLHWSVWSKIASTALAQQVYSMLGKERMDIGEDAVTTFLMLAHAKHVAYLPEELYIYHLGVGITAAHNEAKARAIATEAYAYQALRQCLTDAQLRDARVADALAALHDELLDAVMWNVLNIQEKPILDALTTELSRHVNTSDFLSELRGYYERVSRASARKSDQLQEQIVHSSQVWAQEHQHWAELEQHYLRDMNELRAAHEQDMKRSAEMEQHYLQDIGELKAALQEQVQQHQRWEEMEQHYLRDLAELRAGLEQQEKAFTQAREQDLERWAEQEKHYLYDIQKLQTDVNTEMQWRMRLEKELDEAIHQSVIEHIKAKRNAKRASSNS